MRLGRSVRPCARLPLPGAWPASDLEVLGRCPVCGATARRALHTDLRDRVFFSAPGEWRLLQCGGCRAAYLDPRPTEASIGRAYERYYTRGELLGIAHLGRRGRLAISLRNGYLNHRYGCDLVPATAFGRVSEGARPRARRRTVRAVRELGQPVGARRLLDVGCGSGGFVHLMTAVGWRAEGVDVDPVAVRRARERGLNVRAGALTEVALPRDAFDAVTMSHVVEHLHDPVRTLRECRRILAPGGILWVATPNLGSPGHGRYGPDWLGLDPPRHVVLFGEDGLRRALDEAGFADVRRGSPELGARRSVQASESIAAGVDPADDGRRQAVRQRLRALAWDTAAWLAPAAAEEIVLVARA